MTRATSTEAKAGPFAGLTDRQVATVLDIIASSADTLARFASFAAERAFSADRGTAPLSGAGYDFHVIQSLAERIGALADLSIGGKVCGSPAQWFCGSDFDSVSGLTAMAGPASAPPA